MKTLINENISFHYIPMEKLKTSTIGIYIHRPLKKETAAMNGILPLILKKGCTLCPDTAALERFKQELYGASVGSGIIKRGESQIIHFSFEAISDKYAIDGEPVFEKLTSLAMSMVFEPVTKDGGFDPVITEQEKKNLCELIESMKNDKRRYASQRCIEEMFEGECFAINKYGTASDVSNIEPRSLYEYYKSIITSSVIDIYVCGDVDCTGIINTIKATTEKFAFTKGDITKTGIATPKNEVKYTEEALPVTQGKLSMGFTTETSATGDDYYALMVANSIFGSGAHSKLFNNVREKLSLAYYASSSMDRSKGIIVVNAGIEFSKYKDAYDEILVQLDELKAGNISELEYSSAVNAIVNSLKACFDDQYAMQSFYLSEHIYNSGLGLRDIIEKIKSITVEDAVKAAQKIKLDTVYFLKGDDNDDAE